MSRRTQFLFVTALLAFAPVATLGVSAGASFLPWAAQVETPASVAEQRPLPDTAVLMHAVEDHQRQDEARLKDYLYRQTQTLDQADGKGGVKKREVRTFDVFWLQGVPVRKMTSKNGTPLSADDLKKEDDRIEKEVKSAREKREKNDDKGRQTDPRGNEEVTVSRILELGTFSNARRIQLSGRDTIVVDYAGDPKAKTRNRAEEVIRDLHGTVWIDEADKEIVKTEGRFFRSFKIGGGLVANVHEGTRFGLEQQKINGEVWLPTRLEGEGAARFLLFFNFNGRLQVVDDSFRKFKTSSTLLPGVGVVEDTP